jgi:hypothetical protein
MMRRTICAALCFAILVLTGAPAHAALPIRKPDAEAVVEKVVPATNAEKAKGVEVTIFLKDRKDGVPVTKDTPVHIQMGKLVPVGAAADLKPGQKVSVWLDAKTGAAEGVLVFP